MLSGVRRVSHRCVVHRGRSPTDILLGGVQTQRGAMQTSREGSAAAGPVDRDSESRDG